MKKLTALFLVLLFSLSYLNAATFYVHTSGDDTNNGTSWATAFETLQKALDEATSGDEIWVAAGTYYPTSDYGLGGSDRYMHFRMKNGVTIYGGFPDTGAPDMDDRDWETYETILSGDLNEDDEPGLTNRGDNCYHVFYHPDGLGLDDTALLDGITITAGNANGTNPHYYGGGMHNNGNSPTIRNCLLIDNVGTNGGGGMYNDNSHPLIYNCRFINNTSGIGGGIYNNNSNSHVLNCFFSGNNAFDWGGGGMFNEDSNPVITNSIFIDNTTGGWGGALRFNYSNPVINNCVIANNSSTNRGGGIYFNFSNAEINNSIIWGNDALGGKQLDVTGNSGSTETTVLNYSCYSNGDGDVAVNQNVLDVTNNNITTNPEFLGSGDHPYSLQPTSPCLNSGSNGLIPEGITNDIIGNPRISFGTVDMGAYELNYYSFDVSITPNEISDICYDSPVDLVENESDVTVNGAVAPLTYSWSPTFLVEHTDPSSPVATLTRAIRGAVYTLTVTDANGMQGSATVSVEVLAGNVITAPGTIVHSFRAEDITEPLNLFALALGEGYAENYADYDLEFECRLGWLPPGEVNCEEFDPTYYLPLPNSRLYGWIIIKHSGGCEADRRRINVIVRGNELEIEEEG